MIDIVNRLTFDATRCELQFSKGVAANISEGAAEIGRQRSEIARLRAALLRIDGINDNPAHYNEEINAVVWKALRDEQSKDAKNG